MPNETPKVISVSLNPCIDRGIEVSDFAIGAHQVGRSLFRRPAGKAVNVARLLGKLDVPSLLIGFIGREQQEYFERYLNHPPSCCQLFPVNGETRENITIFDPSVGIQTHIRDRGFEITPSDTARLRKSLAQVARPGTIVTFSGSLPPGLSTDEFLELVQLCQSNQARVAVDCSGAVLRACRTLEPWLIKPNLAELSEMLEQNLTHPAQIVAAGNELKSAFSLVLATAGADGAYLFSKEISLHGKVVIAPQEVTTTVGCGDAALAGFLAGIATGKDLAGSFTLSLAVATAAITARGPGEIALARVERFLQQVALTRL